VVATVNKVCSKNIYKVSRKIPEKDLATYAEV